MNFSELIANFHFLQPFWLLALPLAWVSVAWLFFKPNAWAKVIDPALLPRQSQRQKMPYVLLTLALTLVIIALANPAWEKVEIPSSRQGQVFVLQMDQSMDNDRQGFPPLVQARFLIEDILRATPGRSSALIAYAEIPFTVTPLTEDQATLLAHLAVLNPKLLPQAAQYSQHPAEALEKAAELLRQAGFRSGDIFLVSQGLPEVSRKKIEQVIGMRKQENFRVSFIYTPGENPQHNTQADQALIQRYGGLWLSPEKSATFSQSVSQNATGQEKKQSTTATWQGRGIFFLLPLLFIVPWFFRRGIFLWLCCLPLLLSEDSLAWQWQDLWQRPDQQKYFSEKEHIFREKQAIEAYQAENYQQAAETFAQGQQPESFYNLGNALAKQGHYESAIAAYDQALHLRPDFAEAIHNRQLLTELLQNQEEKAEESQSEESQSEASQSEESEGNPSEGNESESNKSESNKSESNKSEGNESEGNKSEGNKSEGNKSEGNESEGNESEGNESEGNESEGNESEGNKSEGNESEGNESEGNPSEGNPSEGNPSEGNPSEGNNPESNESPSEEKQQETPSAQSEEKSTNKLQDSESKNNEISAETFQNPGQALSEQERQTAEQAVQDAAKQSSTIPKSDRSEGEKPALSDPAALEQSLLLEQWLRRIPDDPGLLLQRKFYYQYQQQR